MRQLLGIMSMVYSFGVIAQSEAPKLVSDQLTLVDLRAKFEGFQYVESENVNISIVKRFESGDTFLIDSIEQILNSENKELRHKLYNNFQFDVSDNFNFSPRLQSAILKNLIIDEDIEEVIWISGRFNFKGFKESFEKNIKSLPIESQITMLYWLGVDGTSKIGIDLIEEILLSDKLKQFWSRGLSDALCNYLAHGDSVNREAELELH